MKKLYSPQVIKSTSQAVCLQVHFQNYPPLNVWFPLSQVHFETDEEGNTDFSGDVWVEDWIHQVKSKEVGDEILIEN